MRSLRLGRLVGMCVALTASTIGTGCGGVWYTARINSVESKVEQAKELGADITAPYQYYSARERVEKAKEEASKADYSDAIELIDEAEEYADKAIDQAAAVRKGAGR